MKNMIAVNYENFPIRVVNILTRYRLNDIGVLVQCTADELLTLRCMRQNDVADIQEVLAEHDLKLSGSPTGVFEQTVNQPEEVLSLDHNCLAEVFPESVCGSLKAAGLLSHDDFAKHTEAELLAIPNVTASVVNRIKFALSLSDMKLAE